MSLIAREFKKRDIQVKSVFIMREPLARFQSMIQFYYKQQEMVPSRSEELRGMHAAIDSPETRIRGDYATAIQNLESVFGEDVYFAFYEELFTDESIRSLCEFLNIPFVPGNYTIETNHNKFKKSYSEEELAPFRERLAGQYAFVAGRFGEERVRGLGKPIRQIAAQITLGSGAFATLSEDAVTAQRSSWLTNSHRKV